MTPDNPTVKERLVKLEEKLEGLERCVRNDLGHRIARVEVAVYLLVLGGFAALGAYVLERLGG